jgi:hypothetical protein
LAFRFSTRDSLLAPEPIIDVRVVFGHLYKPFPCKNQGSLKEGMDVCLSFCNDTQVYACISHLCYRGVVEIVNVVILEY